MTEPATWTDARIARLTELWRAGKSATEIAVDLGGVSRNAVMGKVHRLKLHHDTSHNVVSDEQKAAADKRREEKRVLAQRTAGLRVARRQAAERLKAEAIAKRASAPPRVDIHDIARPAPRNMALIDLGNGNCRFPVEGEKAGTLFCGHNVDAGGTYCTYHTRVAYIPRAVRLAKKRAA